MSLVARRVPQATVVRTWPLYGGISASSVAFELQIAGRSEVFIARLPGDWSYENNEDCAGTLFRLLQGLQSLSVKSPEPVWLEEGPRPLLVMRYISGKPELQPTDLESFVNQYADQLVAIHQIDYLRLGMVAALTKTTGFDEQSAMNGPLRESEIRSALDSHQPILNQPVLRHGDLWPGNLLWSDGQLVGVIDWEECIVGEPLADLAICRLDLLFLFGWESVDAFTRRYLSASGVDSTWLWWWDLRASLRPVGQISAWATSYPPLGRPDVTEQSMTQAHSSFVTNALARP